MRINFSFFGKASDIFKIIINNFLATEIFVNFIFFSTTKYSLNSFFLIQFCDKN